mmetsp:Transcript_21625/g.66140  ORF Transcript_21625/g.66140 Transcript_21625/m.66140 type:complete len:215 (+) Transcript_21625:484-1128(+)
MGPAALRLLRRRHDAHGAAPALAPAHLRLASKRVRADVVHVRQRRHRHVAAALCAQQVRGTPRYRAAHPQEAEGHLPPLVPPCCDAHVLLACLRHRVVVGPLLLRHELQRARTDVRLLLPCGRALRAEVVPRPSHHRAPDCADGGWHDRLRLGGVLLVGRWRGLREGQHPRLRQPHVRRVPRPLLQVLRGPVHPQEVQEGQGQGQDAVGRQALA